MKIFNWVHRRFNNNNKAENAKNNGDIDIDEQYFPVDENKGNHVLERWRGGILTIGTLGYDPFKDENEQLADDYFYEEVETEDEEQNPLVVANAEVAAELMEMAENEEEEEEDVQQFGYEYMMMKKEERITLADLFSADAHADDPDDLDQDQKQAMNKIKPAELLVKDRERSFHRKHALSKLIIAKDARPIHKFNQLMRRMLKRKIHPDVGPINPATSTDDSASLLPTQVIADAKI